jgi:hypothetical protein
LGIVIGLSLLIWKGWPLHLTGSALATNFFISQLWPYTLLLGVPLLLTRSPALWMIGGALCTPYLQFYHLVPVLAYLYRRLPTRYVLIIAVLSWLVGGVVFAGSSNDVVLGWSL